MMNHYTTYPDPDEALEATYTEVDRLTQELLVTQHEMTSVKSYVAHLENENAELHAALSQAREDMKLAMTSWRGVINKELDVCQ